MKRIHKYSAALSIWAAVLTQVSGQLWIITALIPVVGLFGLGVYMLASLIHGVATFNTVPEEYESLKKDVAEARADLIALGVLTE